MAAMHPLRPLRFNSGAPDTVLTVLTTALGSIAEGARLRVADLIFWVNGEPVFTARPFARMAPEPGAPVQFKIQAKVTRWRSAPGLEPRSYYR